MRISFDALRLCLLVAAGVTSGYLWRAAFESTSPAEQRVAATPRIVHPAPAPPTVRIVPRHLTAPTKRAATHHAVIHGTQGSPTALASQPVGSPSSSPASGTPTPQKPTPTPTPTPKPSPPPTTTTTPPTTTTTTTTTTPSVAEPVQQTTPPASATPTTPPPTETPTPPPDETRPGWGNGDKNHDHSGPGGKGK